jgi:hypothetical protein
MKVYQLLVAGDPKNRTYRTLVGDIVNDHLKYTGNAKD